MRKNSIKNTRINGEVQRALAEIIRGDLKDPRIGEVTSHYGPVHCVRREYVKAD